MSERRLLIVQPWLGAYGHPAQSVIALAGALHPRSDVEYLVSMNPGSELCKSASERLSKLAQVHTFAADTLAAESNTVKAWMAVLALQLKGIRFRHVFFFDSSLPVIARYWPLIKWLSPKARLSVLHMHGPELVQKNPETLRRVRKLLEHPEVTLYLRTDELTRSWVELMAQAGRPVRIKTLPSLEIPDDESATANAESAASRSAQGADSADTLAFGILGQIRVGKGIEWLVPAFVQQPALGKLTVAGEFNTAETQHKLAVLRDYAGFVHRFLPEAEMLAMSRQQDYLLMLYQPWDGRMESAVLYLAARVGRPVVVYGNSWCSRMVEEFGCGVVVPFEQAAALQVIAQLPRPGSTAYSSLVAGMLKFRDAHSMKSLQPTIVRELLG